MKNNLFHFISSLLNSPITCVFISWKDHLVFPWKSKGPFLSCAVLHLAMTPEIPPPICTFIATHFSSWRVLTKWDNSGRRIWQRTRCTINLGNFNVGWSSYSFIVSLTHSLRWYYTYVLCGKTDLLGCSSLLFLGSNSTRAFIPQKDFFSYVNSSSSILSLLLLSMTGWKGSWFPWVCSLE